MLRNLTGMMIIGLTSAAGSAVVTTQGGTPPRVAAVRFVLEQGWQVPRADIVVLTDTHLGAVDGHPVIQTASEKEKETVLIANLLGPGARIGVASKYLSCSPPWACVTSTDSYVLYVSGLYQGEADCQVVLYVPHSRNSGTEAATHALLELGRLGSNDWVGVRYKAGPRTVTLRRR